jgi:putative phage-type endonuclease
MPITEKQRQKRPAYLGSSDLAVILNVSPYRITPGDIYWSKKTPTESEPTEAMSVGNYLEEALLRFFCDETGNKITRNQFRVAFSGRGKGVFAANCDAIVQDKPEIVEAKYANAEYAQQYGEVGSDQVPVHVVVQVQQQMYCTGAVRAWVVAALAGFGLAMRLYCVHRDKSLIKTIVDKGMDWWKKHVVAGVPPEGAESPPIDFLSSIERKPGSVIELTAEAQAIAEEFEKAKALEKEWDENATALRTKLIQALGEAEIGRFTDGRTLEFQARTTTRFDKTMFTADQPELAAQYTKESSYRALIIKKARTKAVEVQAEAVVQKAG